MERVALLKEEGEYVVARLHEGFNVSLFTFRGLYIEVWQRFGLNYVEFVEVLNSKAQLSPYLDRLDLDLSDLDLH